MKKIFLLSSFVIVFSVSTFSQTLYLNENFDYGTTANPNLPALTTNWVIHSGAAGQGPQYVYPGLTYAGYPSSGVGGGAGMTFGSSGTNDADAHRVFSSVISASTIVYSSFLVNITAAKPTADYFIHLMVGVPTSSTIYRARPYVISNGSGYSINFSKATETAVVGTNVLDFNKTYLFVIKYSFSTATADDDQATLYIYASGIPASEPGTPLATYGPVGAGTSNDPPDLGGIGLRQGTNGMTGTVDGIRVADSWSTLFTATSVEDNDPNLPSNYELSQNYPNPFNPETVISYQLPEIGHVTLKIYNTLGEEVALLVNENKSPGYYKVNFDGSKLTSGIYFYTIQTNGFTQSKKMLLIK